MTTHADLQDLPEPVADLTSAYRREMVRGEVDWMRAFYRMLDVFEASLAFGALVAACDVVRSDGRVRDADEALSALRGAESIAIGTWWRVLTGCLRDQSPHVLFAPGLLGLVDNGEGGLRKLLEAIPGIRNSMRGHAFTLQDGAYRQAVEMQAPLLERTLLTLASL